MKNIQKKRKRIKKADWRHHGYHDESQAQMAGGFILSVYPAMENGVLAGENFSKATHYAWFVSFHGTHVKKLVGSSRNRDRLQGLETSRIAAQRKALAAYKKFIQNQHPEW